MPRKRRKINRPQARWRQEVRVDAWQQAKDRPDYTPVQLVEFAPGLYAVETKRKGIFIYVFDNQWTILKKLTFPHMTERHPRRKVILDFYLVKHSYQRNLTDIETELKHILRPTHECRFHPEAQHYYI